MADENGEGTLEIECPLCEGRLVIDIKTGAVIHAARSARGKLDFDAAVGEVKSAQERREKDFVRAFQSERGRREILEKKFKKAQEEAESDPRPRKNPLDLD